MALKTIKVKVNEKATATKSTAPVHEVAGDVVKQFNAAVVALKQAEASKKELEAQIKELAITPYYEVCVENPTVPTASIKIVDETQAVVRYTSKNQYKAVDAEPVCALFETELGVDVNEYVHETVVAAFDSKVYINESGDFDKTRYNAFKKAIDKAAAELGVETPLSSKKVVVPKPDFHEKRYVAFPDVETQVKISQVLPNTVALAAVVE